MHEIRCTHCFTVAHVEYDTVSLVNELPKFCPYCGSADVVPTKVDSYWYDLAEAMGFPKTAEGAEDVHQLYRLWEPSVFGKFRDFVVSVVGERQFKWG